ncbi:MAG: DUF58 domain-containing protein [Planctomycetales bacterium]|nr:DUF58 domain-containing protein [Planctomycetales bacterium]
MTTRCRAIVILAGIGLSLGVLRDQPTLTVLTMGYLLWLFAAWCLFQIRVATFVNSIQISRTIQGQPLRNDSRMWSGRSYLISVRMVSSQPIAPILIVRDLISDRLQIEQGSVEESTFSNVHDILIEYRCRALAAGNAVFGGIYCCLQDPQRLFISHCTLGNRLNVTVLPDHQQQLDARPSIKRLNSLPRQGIHRLRRAGLGSELLDLREYQDGDPPKSIAWKVSARRDRLMTRQYESEVPVRVHVILDSCPSLRLGGFGFRMQDQLDYVGTSVAKAAIAAGDAIGLSIVDVDSVQRTSCAFGEKTFYRFAQLVAENSSLPAAGPADLRVLIDRCLTIAQLWHPELLERGVNIRPWRLFPLNLKKASQLRARRRLANVFGEQFRLSPLEVGELVYNDAKFAVLAQRWLHDCGHGWLPPVVSSMGAWMNLTPSSNMRELANELTLLVSRAQDNEVFVILCNLLNYAGRGTSESWSHFLTTIKHARANHHRVVVVCPTPHLRRFRPTPEANRSPTAEDVRRQTLEMRFDHLAATASRQVRKQGGTLVFSGDRQVASIIMQQAELAGSGRLTASR